jgi:uncharacterized membrane protein YkvA (DUF1232 family)
LVSPIMGLRSFIRRVRDDVAVVAIALGDPRTPLLPKLIAIFVVGYALSPIDLIPDAIPVLGLLDDALLVPLGAWLVLKLLPAEVLDDARARVAAGERAPRPAWAVVLVVVSWGALVAASIWAALHLRA